MVEDNAAEQHFDILVLPDTNLILLASVIEPLRAANRIAGRPLYRWTITSPDGSPVETTSGIPIPVTGAFRPRREADPLFVVASYNWRRSATTELKSRLARTAGHRRFVAGIETGAWMLAEAGLMDGSPAAVHWEDFEDFSAAYPQVQVLRERFVIDNRRVTSAGPLPTLDLMLELIRRASGYSLALEVSRLFIYEQGRAESGFLQAPAIGNMRALDSRLQAAIAMMERSIDAPLPLPRLAKRAGISTRHLQDLFRDLMGVTPGEHYLALRLNAARRKVIETRASLTDIAAAAGFNSPSAFSRSYRGQYQESPSDTRRRLTGAGRPGALPLTS